ncbi:GIY-YIG nuclease family protein [Rubrivirga sp.]|uniref:GIY-YIG nuclease family protein n=1 Tax=Rubrivirga sp. TaxID=1885344 RepID=UPI003C77EEF5
MPKPGYVYLLASRRNGTLYIGVTSDLVRRIDEHKRGVLEGFSKEHGTTRLVYVEPHDRIEDAIRRERQLKKWNRSWKLQLIEDENPAWRDLYSDWCETLVRSRPVLRKRPRGRATPGDLEDA